jgi:hypothetical protein
MIARVFKSVIAKVIAPSLLFLIVGASVPVSQLRAANITLENSKVQQGSSQQLAIGIETFTGDVIGSSGVIMSAPGTPVADIGVRTEAAMKAPKEAIVKALGTASFMYIMNLLSFALDRAAYDSAVAIAAGAAGEGPLFDRTPLEDIAKEYSSAVAGEALGLLQDELESIDGEIGAVFQNFNLCAPDDPLLPM